MMSWSWRWMAEYWKEVCQKNKQKLVDAWVSLHEDELRANWKMLSDGDGYFKVEPLR